MRNLLILFGEYRNFDLAIPQLKNLDKFDVIVSTWDYSQQVTLNELREQIGVHQQQITKNNIIKYIPHATPIILKHGTHSKYNTTNMINHWKLALKSIGTKRYDKIILHRCDMISTFHTLLDTDFEEDILYCEPGMITHGISNWFNDYIVAGTHSIMEKFITTFELKDYPSPHIPIFETINQNNIKFNHIDVLYPRIKYHIIRVRHRPVMNVLNTEGICFFDLDETNKLYKKFIQISHKNIQ